MRLIDADALEYTRMDIHISCETIDAVPYYDIESAPTIDAVPVVRCRDCDLQSGCKVAQRLGNDGFCSYGERKDGDG